MYGTRHTRDYGESVPDIWRSAIKTLKPYEIERGLRRLTTGGSGSPPTLPQFMKACRSIGDEDSGPAAPDRASLLPLKFDPYQAHGQKCLFRYLLDNEVNKNKLQLLIDAKNKIVDQYRQIATEENISGAELRDALFKEFDRRLAI